MVHVFMEKLKEVVGIPFYLGLYKACDLKSGDGQFNLRTAATERSTEKSKNNFLTLFGPMEFPIQLNKDGPLYILRGYRS